MTANVLRGGWRSLCVALLLSVILAAPAAAAPAGSDYPIQGGWFFTEANGQGGGPGQPGYAITNDDGISFFDTFRQGGVTTFGYPASPRFNYQGFTEQVTQRAVFQAQTSGVTFLNVMDVLHDNGKDTWLQATYQTPPSEDNSPDAFLTTAQIQARHQALLGSNAALQAAYFAVSNPLAVYGLPMTHPTSEFNGQALVVRCQRAVLQLWLFSEPWAAAGTVTVANGGDIFKASGIVPASLLAPIANVPPNTAVPQASAQTVAAAVLLTAHDVPGFAQDPAGVTYVANGAKTRFWEGQPPLAAAGVFNQVLVYTTPQDAQAVAGSVTVQMEQGDASSLTNATITDKGDVSGLGQISHAFEIDGTNTNGVAVQVFDVYFAEQAYAVQVTLAGENGQVTLAQTVQLASVVDGRIPKS